MNRFYNLFNKTWDHFWYGEHSVLPLTLVRIYFSVLSFSTAVLFIYDRSLWFGPNAILSFAQAQEILKVSNGVIGFTIFNFIPLTMTSVNFVIGIWCLASISLLFGYFKRISAVFIFVAIVSLKHRNPWVFYNFDMVIVCWSFFMIFYPKVENGYIKSSVVLRLIQIQFTIIYFSTALYKMKYPIWRSGLALYYLQSYPSFRPFPYLFNHLWSVQMLTWLTLLIEILIGWTIWVPKLKWPTLFIVFMFHLSMACVLGVIPFHLAMLGLCLAFIRPEEIDLAKGHCRSVAKKIEFFTCQKY